VNSLLYNPVAKMFSFFGTTTLARYKDNSTYITSYVSNDNIYNTFNSNTRFADTIEYQPQNISTSAGNNHFTTLMFNRPVINFDTTSSNANIMLQGISYNGRVGTKFTIQKTISSTHNVRIHGYENCRIITPFGVNVSFNHQSSPQTYSIIPAGYFGSFCLTRVDDTIEGTWLIDNVDIYDLNGVEYKLDDLTVAGTLTTNTLTVTSGISNLTLTGTTIFDGLIQNNNQVLAGTNSVSTFTKPDIYCNTSSANVNITLVRYTTGTGQRFRIHKTNENNAIRIQGIPVEVVSIRTPITTVASFSDISSPNVITIIPANYQGSFDLYKADQTSNLWIVDNLDIFDGSGKQLIPNNLQIGQDSNEKNLNLSGRLIVSDSSVEGTRFDANVTVTGTFLNFKESIKDITATSEVEVTSANILTYAKYNYIVTSSTDLYIELHNLNNAAFDNTTLYFCGAENYTGTSLYIDNQMGTGNIIKVYKNGGITTLTNTQDTTIDKDQWVRCTYKHNYRSGNNYWLCHEYNSSA
jgi:hypothetical protein